jgi:hypothetical protein
MKIVWKIWQIVCGVSSGVCAVIAVSAYRAHPTNRDWVIYIWSAILLALWEINAHIKFQE